MKDFVEPVKKIEYAQYATRSQVAENLKKVEKQCAWIVINKTFANGVIRKFKVRKKQEMILFTVINAELNIFVSNAMII